MRPSLAWSSPLLLLVLAAPGNGTSVVHRFPYSATNFYTYEKVSAALRALALAQAKGSGGSSGGISGRPRLRDGTESLVRFTAGAVAGAVATVGCYPLDLVRTRLTTQVSATTPASSYFYYCCCYCVRRRKTRDARGGACLFLRAPALDFCSVLLLLLLLLLLEATCGRGLRKDRRFVGCATRWQHGARHLPSALAAC